MRLQAITVSVNYADFLRCIAPNKRHFDRWIIVTHASDLATIAECNRHGLEYILSDRVYQYGATFAKAKAINDGLSVLDPNGWVILLDSDIYLPDDFRKRLDSQQLDPSVLYGLAGRRMCHTFQQFDIQRQIQPWAYFNLTADFIVGYFQMFNFSQPFARLPENVTDDATDYDRVFSSSFQPVHRQKLPITCLHLGAASTNWRGRRTPQFSVDGVTSNDRGVIQELTQLLNSRPSSCRTSIIVDSYADVELIEVLCNLFQQVLWIDHWALSSSRGCDSIQRDRAFTYDTFIRQTASFLNLHILGTMEERLIDSVLDESIDVVLFAQELDTDYLMECVPSLTAKLNSEGQLLGFFYNGFLWPETVAAVNSVIGSPTGVYERFTWESFPKAAWGSVHSTLPIQRTSNGLNSKSADGEPGVVFVVKDEVDCDNVVVSLYALKSHWLGPVVVVSLLDSAELKAYSIRFGARYLQLPRQMRYILSMMDVIEYAGFRELLLLKCNAIVDGPLAKLLLDNESASVVAWHTQCGSTTEGPLGYGIRWSGNLSNARQCDLRAVEQEPTSDLAMCLDWLPPDTSYENRETDILYARYSADELTQNGVFVDGEIVKSCRQNYPAGDAQIDLEHAFTIESSAIIPPLWRDAPIVMVLAASAIGSFLRTASTWRFSEEQEIIVLIIEDATVERLPFQNRRNVSFHFFAREESSSLMAQSAQVILHFSGTFILKPFWIHLTSDWRPLLGASQIRLPIVPISYAAPMQRKKVLASDLLALTEKLEAIPNFQELWNDPFRRWLGCADHVYLTRPFPMHGIFSTEFSRMMHVALWNEPSITNFEVTACLFATAVGLRVDVLDPQLLCWGDSLADAHDLGWRPIWLD